MGSAECALHALLLNPHRAVYRLRNLLREFIPCEVSWRADFNRLAAQDGRFHSKSGLVFAGAIFHGFSQSRLGKTPLVHGRGAEELVRQIADWLVLRDLFESGFHLPR